MTLNSLINDNKEIRSSVEKMAEIVRSNKFQLQEYLNKITNKDSAVQSLNKTIDYLRLQLQNIQDASVKAKPSHSAIINDTNISCIGRLSIDTARNKPHCGLIGNTFDNDKFKDYCDKQHCLLEEISKIRFELDQLIISENKAKEIQKRNEVVIKRRKINLMKVFNEDCLKKLMKKISNEKGNNNENDNENDNHIDYQLKHYIIDNYNHVWEMKLRKDLNEDNIFNLKFIHSAKSKTKLLFDSNNNNNTTTTETTPTNNTIMHKVMFNTENNTPMVKPIKSTTQKKAFKKHKSIRAMMKEGLLFNQ